MGLVSGDFLKLVFGFFGLQGGLECHGHLLFRDIPSIVVF